MIRSFIFLLAIAFFPVAGISSCKCGTNKDPKIKPVYDSIIESMLQMKFLEKYEELENPYENDDTFITFPKPKGIPKTGVDVKISNKSGGMRYVFGKNKEFEVRVMPGNPNSSNLAQRTLYVIHQTPKGALDKFGNIVPFDSVECHIPYSEYNFCKLNLKHPYE